MAREVGKLREVTIKIKKGSGEVVIDAAGFAGKECLAATEVFEKALGEVEKRTPKPEMYTTERQRYGVKVSS